MQQQNPGCVTIAVGAGELIDKITILQIKQRRIRDRQKLAHIDAELAILERALVEQLPLTDLLRELQDALFDVNMALWDAEDALRALERDGDFGSRFVELARSVYRHNDRRAALKREINASSGSQIVEEKSYDLPGYAPVVTLAARRSDTRPTGTKRSGGLKA